jgi:large subunit ribosomal protein L29
VSKTAITMTGFRDLPDEELRQALVTARDEQFRLQLGQYTNQVTSSAGLQTKRRDIARILTILNARALGKEKQAEKKATEAAPAEAEPVKKAKKTKKAKS